jgi:hypothetical protein
LKEARAFVMVVCSVISKRTLNISFVWRPSAKVLYLYAAGVDDVKGALAKVVRGSRDAIVLVGSFGCVCRHC